MFSRSVGVHLTFHLGTRADKVFFFAGPRAPKTKFQHNSCRFQGNSPVATMASAEKRLADLVRQAAVGSGGFILCLDYIVVMISHSLCNISSR